MGDKIDVTPYQGLIIIKSGSFNLNDLYKKISMWYFNKGYDFTEKENSNKIGSSGSEVKLDIMGDRKIDSYVKFHIDILIAVLEYKGGQGKFHASIKAYLELDYDNKWEKTAFDKFLRHIYNSVIIKTRIKKYYGSKLYLELVDFSKAVKSPLGLLQ